MEELKRRMDGRNEVSKRYGVSVDKDRALSQFTYAELENELKNRKDAALEEAIAALNALNLAGALTALKESRHDIQPQPNDRS